MYNLVVSSLLPDLAEDQPLEVSRSRFLEYTSDSIKTQLRSLSTDAVAAILSWPVLVMAEGKGDERAYIAKIVDVSGQSELAVRLQRLGTLRHVINDDIWKARDVLDIEQFEFSRHHWAVKHKDLVRILHSQGLVSERLGQHFRPLPLPSPPRASVLEARTIIGEWGHTEIDDLLLEAGVPELKAGKDVGSRRDRANAIARFVFNNPDATTTENRLLSTFVVEVARRSQPAEAGGEESEPQRPVEPPSVAAVVHDEPRSPNRVFVVHGRDEPTRRELAEYLIELGLEPIVLHEQPNMGRHLLTKFIEEAYLVTFAVVLMTADDIGGLTASELRPRARQNVTLELGYFLSHLGQPRVCALITPGLETPSDFDGVVYIQMAPNGAWKNELRRELAAAKMPVS